MNRWLVVAVMIGCSWPRPTTVPPRIVSGSATIATPDATIAVARSDATTQLGDPPEPVVPVMECNVKPRPVYCRGGFPVRSAYQPAPFSSCPKTLPAETGGLGSTGKLFSAAETRKAWASGKGECCYLEWTWTACD